MNRKLGSKLILILSLFLFIFTAFCNTIQSVPPVAENTLIVDITGNGNFTSIQDAINSAEVSDTILIRKGIYTENNIKISKKIIIIGEDPSNTIIDCLENIAFIIDSSFVEIKNLQIINTGEFAIVIDRGSGDCTISNCIIDTNYKGVAIDIRSSNNIISDCNLIGYDTSKQGVKIQGSYNIIKSCYLQNFANGILALIKSNYNQISECNILNNENAIDIRLNSNNNVVNNCNINYNLQGIKISQDSNNNLIYLNNFWKNDLDVIDQGNNSWDNGTAGNYWSRYKGSDNNNDGIGDNPYNIYEGVEDRYPFIEMILPDIIIGPPNLVHISGKSDSTPTFTWDSPAYRKGIRGYYVKIDNSPELFIGNFTTWTSTDIVSDGVHTLYVRAQGIDDKLSDYSSVTFSIDSTFIDTDNDGWSDQEEDTYGSDPNNPFNYPLDTDGDHKPNSIDTDDDNDGFSDDQENSYDTDSKDKNDYPLDTDKDGIPDDSSSDGKYSGDEDDDNDGLTDSVEAFIGSDSKDGSDATRLYITGKLYYLVDLSKNGIYDIIYVTVSNTVSGIEISDNDYLIDINKDGSWDYIYRTNDGSISKYQDDLEFINPIWLIVILITLAIIILTIIIFYYLNRRSVEYQKPITQEKISRKTFKKQPVKLPVREKKETLDMITDTKALLQYIQKDVELYMEKLRDIEGQIIETGESQEEIVISKKEQESVKIEEQQKVDKIVDTEKVEYKDKENIIKESIDESEEKTHDNFDSEDEKTNFLNELQKTELQIDKIFPLTRDDVKEKRFTPEKEPAVNDRFENVEIKVDEIIKINKDHLKEEEKNKTDEIGVIDLKDFIKNANKKERRIIDFIEEDME
jgi:hypothetical protein